MGRIYLREIATKNIPHLPLNHPKGYNMLDALANLIFRKNKKTTNTEFERAICGTPLVQAGILKLWGGHESEEAMYINEGKNFALLAVKRGDFKMPDAAISILGEERANELICEAIIELTPRDGLKKSFLEKCSPVTMRDTGQRFREKRAFSEFP